MKLKVYISISTQTISQIARLRVLISNITAEITFTRTTIYNCFTEEDGGIIEMSNAILTSLSLSSFFVILSASTQPSNMYANVFLMKNLLPEDSSSPITASRESSTFKYRG